MLSLSFSEPSIEFGNSTYTVGDIIRGELNATERVTLTLDNVTYTLIPRNTTVEFPAHSAGDYVFRLHGNTTTETTLVVAPLPAQLTTQGTYLLGDEITITISNAPSPHTLKVTTPQATFNLLINTNETKFTPQSTGNYTIALGSVEKNFTITASTLQRAVFSLNTTLGFRVNFSQLLTEETTPLQRVLGSTPLTKLTVYVDSHEEQFDVTLLPETSSSFIARITPQPSVTPGNYTLVFEGEISGRPIREESFFALVGETHSASNLTNTTPLFDDYHFTYPEPIILPLELTDDLEPLRNRIDNFLDRTILEELSVQVENKPFTPIIDHLSRDDFRITIPPHPDMQPGSYRLLVRGRTATALISTSIDFTIEKPIEFRTSEGELLTPRAVTTDEATTYAFDEFNITFFSFYEGGNITVWRFTTTLETHAIGIDPSLFSNATITLPAPTSVCAYDFETKRCSEPQYVTSSLPLGPVALFYEPDTVIREYPSRFYLNQPHRVRTLTLTDSSYTLEANSVVGPEQLQDNHTTFTVDVTTQQDRMLTAGAQETLYFTLTPIGPAVDQEVIFLWPYDHDLLDVQRIGCNGTTVLFNNTPHVRCTWPMVQDTLTFPITVYARQSGLHLTTTNVTYDPPQKIVLTEVQKAPYTVHIEPEIRDKGLLIDVHHESDEYHDVYVQTSLPYLQNAGVIGKGERATIYFETYDNEYVTLRVGDEIVTFGQSRFDLPREEQKPSLIARIFSSIGRFFSTVFTPSGNIPVTTDDVLTQEATTATPVQAATEAVQQANVPTQRIIEQKVWHTTLQPLTLIIEGGTFTQALPPTASPTAQIRSPRGSEYVSIQVENQRQVAGKTHADVTFTPPGRHKPRISLNNTVLESNTLNLGYNELPRVQQSLVGKNVKKIFAIDPTQVTFDSGEVRLTATGTQLLKCASWNFTTETCEGSWEAVQNLTPGVEYSIELGPSDPAWIEIGLVAINTHKSIYDPTEQADIFIGVLNELGHIVCDANVTLAITEPDNSVTTRSTLDGSISVSDECVLEVTALPDYLTNFTVTQVGLHQMNITAVHATGTPTMLSNFSAQNNPAFDLERRGPTRISPFQPYVFELIINPQSAYTGTVVERVPLDFDVYNTSAIITETPYEKVLMWNVSINPANPITLSYTFDAPDLSPYLFELGPVQIGAFSEFRAWQIASDVKTLDSVAMDAPTTTQNIVETATFTITCSPSCSGTGGQPSVTHTYQWCSDASCSSPNTISTDSGTTDILSVANNPESNACNQGVSDTITARNTGTVYIRCNAVEGPRTQNSGTIQINVASNDQTPPSVSITAPTSGNNFSSSFTVTASASDSESEIPSVNLTLLQPSGIIDGPIALNLTTGSLTSGTFSATYDPSPLPDGRYNLSVNATDAPGNTALSANVSITIDTTNANAVATTPANGTNVIGQFLISSTVSDTTSGVRSVMYRLIGINDTSSWETASLTSGTLQSGTWQLTFDTLSLAVGHYNITANVTDYTGNMQLSNISYVVRVADIVPPNVTLIAPSPANVTGSILINASVNDTYGTVDSAYASFLQPGTRSGNTALSLTTGSITAGYWTASFNTATIADGRYNLSVNATDDNGNINTSQNVSITVDNTAPNATIITPSNNSVQTGTILVNASVNDSTSGVQTVRYRIRNAQTSTAWLTASRIGTINIGYWNASYDVTTLPNSVFNVSIEATDFAGVTTLANISTFTVSNVDLDPPNLSVLTPVPNGNVSSPIFVNASLNDSVSGVNTVSFSLRQGDVLLLGPVAMNRSSGTVFSGYFNGTNATTALTDGLYNLTVSGTDVDGNVNNSQNITLSIDNTQPSLAHHQPGSGSEVWNQFFINVSANDTFTGVQNVSFRLVNSSFSSSAQFAQLSQRTIYNGSWTAAFNTSLLTAGTYYIQTNATDFSGNTILQNLSQVVLTPIIAAGESEESVLRPQACLAMIASTTSNNFVDACDGTYPAQCGGSGDRVSCNDGHTESHAHSNNQYSGINVSVYNTTIDNCLAVTSVKVCYERWSGSADIGSCLVSVDDAYGSSWSTANASCPGTTVDPGIVCTDVTALETWTCDDFFGAPSGTVAKIEQQRTAGGPATDVLIDVLYYNVTYNRQVDSTDPPSIEFIDPTLDVTGYDYDGITNPSSSHTAYDGGVAGLAPTTGSPITGTEITTAEYADITNSDNQRLTTTISTSGQRAYQSFVFTISQSPNDIASLRIIHEGFATEQTDFEVDDFHIFVYNYTNGSYTPLTTVAANSFDLVTTLTVTDGFSDLIQNTNVTFLVEGDFTVGGGKNARADLHTDRFTLDVSTIPAISGFKTINVTATDIDGVALCEYRFENASGAQTPFFGLNNTHTDYFSNVSDTTVLNDARYTLRARCYDTPLNQRNITVDVFVSNAAPFVGLLNPLNDTNFTTTNDITFNFNATQPSGGLFTCDLGINGITNVSGILATSSQNISQTISNFNDGYYYWNVTCANSGGAINTTQIHNFTVDLNAPVVTLRNLTQDNISTIRNISFTYVPEDGTKLDSCRIIIDEQINQTNTTTNSGWLSVFQVDNLNEGNHSWRVNCTDVFNLNGTSETRNFTIDYNPPFINLSAPLPAAALDTNDVYFNFTVFDVADEHLTCDLRVNGVLINSSFTSTNDVSTNISSALTDGTKLWNVTCADNAGNTNTSETRTFSIVGPPEVTLSYPDPDQHHKENISFLYVPSDGDGFDNCSIYFNDVLNTTNISAILGDQTNNFTFANLSDQNIEWHVGCLDTTGQQGNSSKRNVTIDSTPPFVNLTGPTNGVQFPNRSVTINFTAFDTFSDILNCSVTVNSVNLETNFSVDNNTQAIRNYTLGSGAKVWNATCIDRAGNVNVSETRTFDILGPPDVDNIAPLNLSVRNGLNLAFSFSVDDIDPIASCSLYIRTQLNRTNETLLTTPGTNQLVTNITEDGDYNWTVGCTDDEGNTGTADYFNITIDNTRPFVNLTAPANGSTVFNSSLQFNFTGFDNLPYTLNCSLTLDGAIPAGEQNFNATPANTVIRNLTSIAEGPHLWNATCSDIAFNANTSRTFTFDVDLPPNITLISPENDTFSGSTTQFEYNASDYFGLTSCQLFINRQLNRTETSIDNNTINTFELTDLSAQSLNWTVGCTDTNGVTVNGTERLLHIDSSPPSVHALSPNATIFNTNFIPFVLNATDADSPSVTCDLIVDDVTVDPEFTAVVNENTTRTVLIIGDGLHLWNVTCFDGALNEQYSDLLNFTIEAGPFTVLQSPANNSGDNDGNITFIYNTTDTNIAVCNLFINGQFNRTNTSLIQSGNFSNFTTTNFTQAVYNWSVGCTDSTGFASNSTTNYFHVDFEAPYLINLTSPENNTNITSTSVTFNFTAFDSIDPLLSCDLYINQSLNRSNINATSGEPTTTSVNGFNPGYHNWSVRCSDNTGFSNTSDVFYFLIDARPVITLSAPETGVNISTDTINFSYTPSSILGIDNCQIFIDEVSEQTDIFIENQDLNTFNLSAMPDGYHNWSITCDDTNTPSDSATSEYRNFTVDRTPPLVQSIGPNGSFINITSVNFNFSSTDVLSSFSTCLVNVNGTSVQTGLYLTNDSSINVTATVLADGYHLWNATCQDAAGNNGTSSSYNFTITQPPTVSLNLPANATRTNLTNQSFNFTAFDNSNLFGTCSVLVDGVHNSSNETTITAGQNTLINVSNFNHGQYLWAMNCSDAHGNNRVNETEYVLQIDTLGPGIDLNDPTEDQVFNIDDINFNFTATDQFDLPTALSCAIYIDGQLNTSVSPVTSGEENITLIEDFSVGLHNWSVGCADDFGNFNHSNNVSFIVNAPDLTLNESGITFNDTNPDANTNITIFANIFNIGGNPVTNATVEFTANNGTDLILIGRVNVTVDPDENDTVAINFTIPLGLHEVTVTADPEELLVELNKTNNNASKNISVLYPQIIQPQSGYITNNRTVSLNFTAQNFRATNLNYTLFFDGLFNTSNLTSDALGLNRSFNFSDGTHTIILQAHEPDPLIPNQFRYKNSSSISITVDTQGPTVNITTLNNSAYDFATPTLFFNITDALDTILNYTVYVNTTIEDHNFTTSGAGGNITLSGRAEGSYLITIEGEDDATNKVNSTPIVIFIDLNDPVANITTQNNTNFSTLTPTISFILNDTLDVILNYTFFVDGDKNDNGTRVKSSNSTNLTTLPEGSHELILEVLDDSGRRSNSTPITIFIDVTPPVISIDNPLENDIEGFLVSLETTITDAGVGVDNVTYYITNATAPLENGSLTAPFDATWDSLLDIDASSVATFVNFTVVANDTLGNTANATVQFVIDNRNPDVTYITPSGTDYNRSFLLNILIENYNLSFSNYSIYNSTHQQQYNVNDSIGNATFVWSDFVNLSNFTNFPEGAYNISVFVNDSAGSVRNQSNFFRVDRTAPNVTINGPLNSTNRTDTSFTINFTSVDVFSTLHTCNVTFAGSVVDESFSVANGTTINRSEDSGGEGRFLYFVSCMDAAGNREKSEERTITVDQSAPEVLLETPENNVFNNSAEISFSYLPIDYLSGIESCSLILDGVVNKSARPINNSISNFTVEGLNEGLHTWNVTCSDFAGNARMNGTRNYTVDLTAPTAAIITANGTYFNISQPNITINLTDNLDTIINYSLYVSAERDVNGTVLNNTRTNATLTFHQDGMYELILEGLDDARNAQNSSPINITIDTHAPNITLNYPFNNTEIGLTTIDFNYSVIDNLSITSSCDLYLDSVVNDSRLVFNDTSVNVTIPNINVGYHNWSVYCTDLAGNSETSDLFFFNITPPDLSITSGNITFNTSAFEENINFTFFATIFNLGEGAATNASVRVYNNSATGNLLYSTTISLAPGANTTINHSVAYAIGTHSLVVALDEDNVIPELSNDNNVAARAFTVPLWNIVSGNLTGDLVLEDINNSLVFTWQTTNVTTGNVFAADIDSAVTWNNLSALSRNATGNYTGDDFAQLDEALNTTGYDDSINRSYTLQGNPRATLNITVFSRNIQHIPVRNSSATSSFSTGILWDVSDSLGAYNGSQDIVFVSPINKSQQGAAGTVDFELSVPAQLRTLITTDRRAVVFYMELQ